MKQIAYVGLGSNLDNPVGQLQQAFQALNGEQTSLESVSDFYVSKPQGPADQPDYVNAVAKLRTSLSVDALLRFLQQIEKQQGKAKKRHWGERCIDLDLLLYGEVWQGIFQSQVIDLPHLQVPHPMMTQRDFVLLPLQALAPELTLSNGKKTEPLCYWIERLPERYVYKHFASQSMGAYFEE